ncbi:hypothetical protein MBLNU230_g6073t1 [Neophaeotheca triangularis]
MQSRAEWIHEQLSLERSLEYPDPRDDSECPICRELLTTDIPLKLSGCKHTFCSTCICDWLLTDANNKCPNCRAAVFNKPAPEFECPELEFEGYFEWVWNDAKIFFPDAKFYTFGIPVDDETCRSTWFAQNLKDKCKEAAEYAMDPSQASRFMELTLPVPKLGLPLMAMGNMLWPFISLDFGPDDEGTIFMEHWVPTDEMILAGRWQNIVKQICRAIAASPEKTDTDSLRETLRGCVDAGDLLPYANTFMAYVVHLACVDSAETINYE